MKNTMVMIALMAGALIYMSACGGSAAKIMPIPAIEEVKQGPMIGSEEIVDKSHEIRPEWTQKTFTEEKGHYLFSADAEGRDKALTEAQAEGYAISRVARKIETNTRNEFSSAAKGANLERGDTDRFVENGVAYTVENLRIQGLTTSEIYFERFQRVIAQDEVDCCSYRVHALIGIDESEVRQAQKEAAKRLAKEANVSKNTAAEQAAQKVMGRLNSY